MIRIAITAAAVSLSGVTRVKAALFQLVFDRKFPRTGRLSRPSG
jgi:hypothetical protein